MTRRVLVCGGRDFRDRWLVYNCLDMIHADRVISCVIAGAASGADHIAANWAKDRGIDLREFPADWKKFGKAAGPMRNRQMVNDGQPDEVVAFPGGRGTADMVRAARAVGLPVQVIVNDSE